MKRLIALTVSVLLSALSAQAITFAIDQEASGPNRLVIEASWGDYDPNADTCFSEMAGLWAVEAHDTGTFLSLNITPYSGELSPFLDITFTDLQNRAIENTIFRFNGLYIEERPKGARFTWEPFPQRVPDSGNTGLLLGLAVAGLGLAAVNNQRKVGDHPDGREA